MSRVDIDVCVLGLGYIGLPLSVVLAKGGARVLGVDTNTNLIETLQKGQTHISEPGLDVLFRSVVGGQLLKFSDSPELADVFIIAVPTPFQGHYEPDMSFVRNAVESIAPRLRVGNLLIIESTCPVGSTDTIIEWLANLRPDLKIPISNDDDSDLLVAYCPERILPGQALKELRTNDRVIGGINQRSVARATEIYSLFVSGEMLATTPRTAEMAKLVENAFRDVNIAFANEVSLICADLNIDVWELIRICNRHPRVNIMDPGVGVGGHCIAVDPWFIIEKSPTKARLMREARDVNLSKTHWVVDDLRSRIYQHFVNADGVRANQTRVLAFLGLSFKPDVDDLRNSPAVEIVQSIAAEFKCEILVAEPHLERLPDGMFETPGPRLVSTLDAVNLSDVCVILVKHSEFKKMAGEIEDHVRLVSYVGSLESSLLR